MINPLWRLMETTYAYRLWMAPFADRKFAPVARHNDLARVRRVLDVGCGPGTNTARFAHAEYLGVDFNRRYIESARKRYQRDYLVADVTTYEATPDRRFDFILANSLFHHIDSPDVRRILKHLSGLLTEGGSLHVLDLVLPGRPSVARLLARADRGDHPRPLSDWLALFGEHFIAETIEPYSVRGAGVDLWQMLYFKGKPRR